jgi:hypothetical protein
LSYPSGKLRRVTDESLRRALAILLGRDLDAYDPAKTGLVVEERQGTR